MFLLCGWWPILCITLNIWHQSSFSLWPWFWTIAAKDSHLNSLKYVCSFNMQLCVLCRNLNHFLCIRLASPSSLCHIESLFGNTMRFVFLILIVKVCLNLWTQCDYGLQFLGVYSLVNIYLKKKVILLQLYKIKEDFLKYYSCQFWKLQYM